ncbi:aminoglycoside phosphotransferase family protein [Roseovarius salinarum]|uniref:aminoglycoside phosphotransferase family protein n=1 Tax=Roseovarius salinarum TaxID=1981892 RepID=UPI000C349A69|nr:phosphotransferase [Roseovarius salinarum]
MTDRDHGIARFLQTEGWAGAQATPLAGDASNRRYLRLIREAGERAVLMDAPPGRGEDVRPFLHIARHLSDLGLSAPRILAADETEGFLLLEDLGDAVFARVLEQDPAHEAELYTAATDLLVRLHAGPPADVAAYDAPCMTELAALAFDWYGAASGDIQPETRGEFTARLQAILAKHAPVQDVLVLRDYHAENLVWLPERSDVARVGLLDFQDAMTGHRAYDLVSLLQDARRDVPEAREAAMIDRYVDRAGLAPEPFHAAYRCLGVQRNLRILGVFARLALRDAKPRYLSLMPRVWAHLSRDLEHPALADLAELLPRMLPAPTPEILRQLEERCPTSHSP